MCHRQGIRFQLNKSLNQTLGLTPLLYSTKIWAKKQSQETVPIFWWIKLRFWIQTGTEGCPFSLSGYEIWALTPSSASSPDLFSLLISMCSRTNRDSPTLQAAYFGVELLWLLYRCLHLPNTLLPCASGPALPPRPWETLTVLWGQCWGPSEAGGIILSVQTGCTLVLFVPQHPLIVGCSGSRLPHDSLADVLSLNK